MFITQEADCAVRIVACLAAAKGLRLDAAEISHRASVSQRFALKILRKLVAGGIALSFKGRSGGYVLAREPAEITLCEVIETVDGPYALSRCLREDKRDCGLAGELCVFRDIYAEISEDVSKRLESVNFGRFA
ncbi:MAG: Rrf2 family transcriptional regulator [Oscillospiraceae bacterium]|nr:Rrf2 family transcriptional regulator [Oscillospiraceae bacterium]